MWEYFRFKDGDAALGWHTFVGFDGDITWAACGYFGQYGTGTGDIEWWELETPPEEAERCTACVLTKLLPGQGFDDPPAEPGEAAAAAVT
jgi:hypothetical protein